MNYKQKLLEQILFRSGNMKHTIVVETIDEFYCNYRAEHES
jgi:hypothetical protein